jgi:hypothetical protein
MLDQRPLRGLDPGAAHVWQPAPFEHADPGDLGRNDQVSMITGRRDCVGTGEGHTAHDRLGDARKRPIAAGQRPQDRRAHPGWRGATAPAAIGRALGHIDGDHRASLATAMVATGGGCPSHRRRRAAGLRRRVPGETRRESTGWQAALARLGPRDGDDLAPRQVSPRAEEGQSEASIGASPDTSESRLTVFRPRIRPTTLRV